MRLRPAIMFACCTLLLGGCGNPDQPPTQLSAAPKQVLDKAHDVNKVIDQQEAAVRKAIEQQEQ